ncbi:MAG: FtsX-like permease family protein [Flavobacteriales bacterium]|nr:FtsX-like permease family protein [Flavobacteriales bacterium]
MKTEIFITRRILTTRHPAGFSRPIVRFAIASISLGLGIMILAVSIVNGFKKGITEKLTGITSHIQITKLSASSSLETEPIDSKPAFYNEIKSMPEVNHIQSFVVKHGILKTKKEIQGVVIKGVGDDFNWKFFQQHLKEGAILTSLENEESIKNIIISKLIANKLNVSVNDSLYVYFLSRIKKPLYQIPDDFPHDEYYEMLIKDSITESKPYAMKLRVTGIYETGMYEMDNQLILAHQWLVQDMYKWNRNQISGFEITLKDYRNLDDITWVIDSKVPVDLYVSNIRENYPEIFEWLPTIDINSIIIIILMILVSIMAMISTLLILILEKTNMIGILKALGMSNFQVRKIFILQAAYIIIQGLILGNIFGIGLCLIQFHFGIIKLDQQSYYLSEVPVLIDWLKIAGINLLTFINCIFVLIFPSYLITRISPVQAIRVS